MEEVCPSSYVRTTGCVGKEEKVPLARKDAMDQSNEHMERERERETERERD